MEMGNRYRLMAAFLWLCALGIQGQAQEITPAERQGLLNHLQQSRAKLEQATKGLSPAQWKFKPKPFRWSAAECLEHIALAEELIFNYIKREVMQAPPPSSRDAAEVSRGDEAVRNTTSDRSIRFQPPEQTRPSQQTVAPDELLKQFHASRERTIEFTSTVEGLRNHCVPGPAGACMDAYQWLLLISGHSERHTRQLLEVQADPNFPKQ
jgi:hypothetical protein